MGDRFESYPRTLEMPASIGFAVTPNDAADLPDVTRALYVGNFGDVTVDMAGGGTLTFLNVDQGVFLPLRVTRVRATGTTATGIVGLC